MSICHKIPAKAFNCPTYITYQDMIMWWIPHHCPRVGKGRDLHWTGALLGKGNIYHLFGYSGFHVYEKHLILHSILLFDSKLGSILIYSMIPFLKVLLNKWSILESNNLYPYLGQLLEFQGKFGGSFELEPLSWAMRFFCDA